MSAVRVVVGVAAMGSFGLAALGFGVGVAHADPSRVAPQVTSSHDGGQAPAPSPYAGYGDASICAVPGLYFVNVCS